MQRRIHGPEVCGCLQRGCPTCWPDPELSRRREGRRRKDSGHWPYGQKSDEADFPAPRGKWRVPGLPRGVKVFVDLPIYLERQCTFFRRKFCSATLDPQRLAASSDAHEEESSAVEPVGRWEVESTFRKVVCDPATIGVPPEAPLAEVRQALLRSCPFACLSSLSRDFIFVHDTLGPISTASEGGRQSCPPSETHARGDRKQSCHSNHGHFRAKDFVGAGAPRLGVRIPGFVEGELLQEAEGQTREYKSLVEPVRHAKCLHVKDQHRSMATSTERTCVFCLHRECHFAHARNKIRDYLDKGYIGSFLNSGGGTILIGVEDDPHRVTSYIDDERGYLTFSEKEMDEILLLVENKLIYMDPSVDEDLVHVSFVPISVPYGPGTDDGSRKPYVIQLHIAPGRHSVYFENAATTKACYRKGSQRQEMPSAVATERLRQQALRSSSPSRILGWRALPLDPDNFLSVVKGARASWKQEPPFCEDFIGRRWIFDRISKALESQGGVVLIGAPSTGKTQILRQLACSTPVVNLSKCRKLAILAYHFCLNSDDDIEGSSKSASFFVRNIIAQSITSHQVKELDRISSGLRDFCRVNHRRTGLLDKDRIQENPTKSLEVFAHAFGVVLSQCSLKSHVTFVLDGVFESLTPSGYVEEAEALSIADMLTTVQKAFPQQLKFVITARQPICHGCFGCGFEQICLDDLPGSSPDGPTVHQDLVEYTHFRLQKMESETSCGLSNGFKNQSSSSKTMVDEICAHACGSYDCVDMLLGCCSSGLLNPEQLIELPTLGAESSCDSQAVFFRHLLSHVAQNSGTRLWTDVSPFLSILCAGKHLTSIQLCRVRWQLPSATAVPEPLLAHCETTMKFIHFLVQAEAERDDEGGLVYHLSHTLQFTQWLEDNFQCGPLVLNVRQAHGLLAAYLLQKMEFHSFGKALQAAVDSQGQMLASMSSGGQSKSSPPMQPPILPLARLSSEVSTYSSHSLEETCEAAETLRSHEPIVPVTAEEVFRCAVHILRFHSLPIYTGEFQISMEAAESGAVPVHERAQIEIQSSVLCQLFRSILQKHKGAQFQDKSMLPGSLLDPSFHAEADTSLYLAVRRRKHFVVQLLLHVRCNPLALAPEQRPARSSALQCAAKMGSADILAQILSTADVSGADLLIRPTVGIDNVPTEHGASVLELATTRGHVTCVDEILTTSQRWLTEQSHEEGFCTQIAPAVGTAIFAAACNNHLKCLESLMGFLMQESLAWLRSPALRWQNLQSRTSLTAASCLGHDACCEELLKALMCDPSWEAEAQNALNATETIIGEAAKAELEKRGPATCMRILRDRLSAASVSRW